jgi:hypothetical protein
MRWRSKFSMEHPKRQWRLWYAWYPVRLMNETWVWLEWVERIGTKPWDTIGWYFRYRLPVREEP